MYSGKTGKLGGIVVLAADWCSGPTHDANVAYILPRKHGISLGVHLGNAGWARATVQK